MQEDIEVTVYVCPACGQITTGKDTPEWYWHKVLHLEKHGTWVESYYPVEARVKLKDIPGLAAALGD